MGLSEVNNALKKIVDITEDIVDGQIGHVTIPRVVMGETLSLESEEVTTIGGLLSSVKSSAANILQLTREIGCLATFLANPGSMGGNILTSLVNQGIDILVYTTTSMVTQVVNAFISQITIAINQVLGTAIGLVTTIFNLLNAIANLAEAIASIPAKFKELANKNIKWFLDKDECEIMFASIAACYINKFLSKLTSKAQTKVNELVNKINILGDGVNETISNELYDVNVMKNYLDRESFLVDKAAKQINNFSFV